MVAKLTSIVVYLTAFYNVVVVNCVSNPQNWKSCSDINAWLIPGIQDGYNIITKPCFYCDEQNAIQEIRDMQTD